MLVLSAEKVLMREI